MRMLIIITAATAAAYPALAGADDCPAKPTLETYYKPAKLPASGTRCKMEKGKCVKVELKGYLYMPKTAGKHPILIDNHGSEENPGDKCTNASYFYNLGYVVFVPHRRGHGKSTGAYLGSYTKDFCSKPGDANFCKMEYLHKQVDDVEEAIKFVKGLPNTADKKIAIMGHSFGGITAVFANTKDLGQRAVIDVAGGSQSWVGNPEASKQMDEAVRDAVAPAFFIEPLNDRSIDPTIELARAAGQACRVYQSAIFPALDTNGDGKVNAADYATTDLRDKAHGGFMSAVADWGPAAHEFMTRFFEKPAQPFDKACRGTSHEVNN